MATHDYIISNASGAAVRADLNNALAAIASNNSSATEPTTTYAYQWWADTGSSPTVMKLRNAANSGWITLFQLDGEWTVVPFENGTAAAPSIYFKDSGTDTGLFSGGTDQVNISTGGTERVEWGTSEVVFNDGGENYDFRIESDTNAQIFFVDASANAVGIGSNVPNAKLTITETANANAIVVRNADTNGSVLQFGINTSIPAAYIQSTKDGSGTAQPLAFYGATSEMARFDTSSRFLLGTSSSSATATAVFQGNSTSSTGAGVIHVSRGSTATGSGDACGLIRFSDNSQNIRAEIEVSSDATGGTNDYPGRLVFSTTADGASSPTERMRIDSGGLVTTQADIFVKGGVFVSDPITTNRYLYKASTGGGTATVYIGNAAIQVSSDARLKDNIQDTSLTAVEELQKVRVVDFTWNDPSDTSYNNRNARGTWTGVIAQELVNVFPFAVNAPRKEDDLSIDYDSDSTWTVEQQQLVPVLIKAIQEQQAVITNLQDRLSALEAQ